MLPWKCAGVGAAENSKSTHVRCGSVRVKKLLCAECADVPKLNAHNYSGIFHTVIKGSLYFKKAPYTESFFGNW